MRFNDKKYQGIFHLIIIFELPLIMVSIFVLESWLIPLVVTLITIVLFVFIKKK